MSENWAPCRNCPHLPDEHQAVIVKPICVDGPLHARVLFEGMLGGCTVEGCDCRMWQYEKLNAKEQAREGREVPDGFELVAIPDADWAIDRSRACRAGGNRPCGAVSAASLTRGRRVKQRWGYCQDHMFGRWIENGQVMHWILREKESADD
jgi:hypothetical protein